MFFLDWRSEEGRGGGRRKRNKKKREKGKKKDKKGQEIGSMGFGVGSQIMADPIKLENLVGEVDTRRQPSESGFDITIVTMPNISIDVRQYIRP